MNNIKSILKLALVLLLLAGAYSPELLAQARPKYEERAFSQERLEGYREHPDYQYKRSKPEVPDPPKEKERVKKEASKYSSPNHGIDGSFIGPFIRIVFWLLIIGGGGFLLFHVLKVPIKGLFKKKSDLEESDFEEVLDPEDLNQMEFEDPIKTAIDQGLFRKATRLLYLKSLRDLQDRSLIKWKREKTNRDYLREIPDRNIKPLFQDITFIFEYIWYGEMQIDRSHFNTAYASFIQFEQALRQGHAE